MTAIFRAFPLAVSALFLSSAALAQEADAPKEPPKEPTVFDGDYLTVGAGVGYGPSYEGSDSYAAFPIVGLQGRVGGLAVAPRPAGAAVDLISDRSDSKIAFNLGPVARARFDRTRQIRDPLVAALGKRDVAVEVGANAGFSIRRVTNPYDSLNFGVDVRWDVAGAHKGQVIMPTVSFLTPVNRGVAMVASVSAEHVDDNYARYYFDVTPAGAAASGLPAYRARAGWKQATASMMTFIDLNGNLADGGFAIVGGLSYSRLLGNIARSPIVEQRGAKDQFFGAVGIAYTF